MRETVCVGLIVAACFAQAVVGVRHAGLHAQSQAAPSDPTFDVASVKPTRLQGTSYTLIQPGGRFIAANFTLRGLIMRAFRLQNNQVDGGPGWISSDAFDIEARAEGNPSPDQVLQMVRALLAERFKLTVRREIRQLPIYSLVMAASDGKLGPQLTPSSEARCLPVPRSSSGELARFDPNRPFCGVLYSPIGHWTGRGVSIREVANALTRMAGRVVSDRTGLTGNFDLDLQWTDLAVLLAPGPLPEGPPPPADGPSLFTALQEQLGLKLEAARGPVEVLIVDHAERPTPD